MPYLIELEEDQLIQLAKDIVPDVRRVILDFQERIKKFDKIVFDTRESKLLSYFIGEMLTGEFKNGKHNTK